MFDAAFHSCKATVHGKQIDSDEGCTNVGDTVICDHEAD